MILTVTSYKGGATKSTTAVHLAAFLNALAPTLLLDGDPTENVTAWSKRGKGFPFRVEPTEALAMLSAQYEHKVIDTGQRPEMTDLAAAVKWSDLVVIPAVPTALDVDGLQQTLEALKSLGATNYRVLITRVAADMQPAAAELRELLCAAKAPTFAQAIPRLKAFEKAAEQGVIVRDVDDRMADRAWRAYEAVGEELSL